MSSDGSLERSYSNITKVFIANRNKYSWLDPTINLISLIKSIIQYIFFYGLPESENIFYPRVELNPRSLNYRPMS